MWHGFTARILTSPLPPNNHYPGMGQRSYHFSAGSSFNCYTAQTNGIYSHWVSATKAPCTGNSYQTGMNDILDGTSNTVNISEKAICASENKSTTIFGQGAYSYTSPTLCLASATGGRYNTGVQISSYSNGDQWAMGHPYWGFFNTILPPNSPTCYQGGSNNPSGDNGFFPPTSWHPGGVLVGMADASVRFVTNGVDCGTYGLPPALVIGVWGAMGTIAGGEGFGLGGAP